MNINFGCGPFPIRRRGWINVDNSLWKDAQGSYCVDEIVDLDVPFPGWMRDVEHAYCGHLLSVSFDDGGEKFLKRVHDVMVPGGIIRVCDFDFDWLFSAFFGNGPRKGKTLWSQTWPVRRDWFNPGRFRTSLEMLNADVRRWGRKYMLNVPTIEVFLMDAGFHDVKVFSPGISDREELRDVEARLGIVQFCVEARR